MIEFYLVRHGETVYNRDGRMQGSLDSSLLPESIELSKKLGKRLSRESIRFDRWFTSPQGRARATSEAIRSQFSYQLPEEQIVEEIREIHCGTYEGLLRESIESEVLTGLMTDPGYKYPDGESLTDVAERGRIFLDDFIANYLARFGSDAIYSRDVYRVMVVSHGNFLRAFATVLTDSDPVLGLRLSLANLGLCILSRADSRPFKITLWNDTSHCNLDKY